MPKAWAEATETRPSFGPSSSPSTACSRWSGQVTSEPGGSPARLKQGMSAGCVVPPVEPAGRDVA